MTTDAHTVPRSVTAPRALALTPKAYLVLDILDARDGARLRPQFGTCSVCAERCTVWNGQVLCMTRADGGRCPGNGLPPRRQS